ADGGGTAGDRAGLPAPEWFMDYRNADGSAAEMCGNGIRVLARYLAGHGLAGGPAFTLATRAGVRQVVLEGDGQVSVCLGPGAVAAAAAAAHAEGAGRGAWRVSVPGGVLGVRLADGMGWLTGPAVIVAEGELDSGWLASAAGGN